MKLEAGKRYVRRDRGVSGVLAFFGGPNDPVSSYCYRDRDLTYAENGRYVIGGTSPLDLVAEYTGPAEAAPITEEYTGLEDESAPITPTMQSLAEHFGIGHLPVKHIEIIDGVVTVEFELE